MPIRPEVFVSATTKDLGSCRHTINYALQKLGCVPIEQTIFPPDYREIKDMLRAKIAACHAVIHVAGECYGTEPKKRAETDPRRSYTQLEYDIARELKKPVYIFVCGASFPFKRHKPEDTECQRLQAAHRAALTEGDTVYTPIGSKIELEKEISKLQLRVDLLSSRLFQVAFAAVVLLAVLVTSYTWHAQNMPTQIQTAVNKGIAQSQDPLADTIARKVLENLKTQTYTTNPDKATSSLDFEKAFREVAEQTGVTPEKVREVVDRWVWEKNKSTDPLTRAKAAMLSHQFTAAAQLYDQAAAADLASADDRRDSAALNFSYACTAYSQDGRMDEALDRNQAAQRYTARASNPRNWAILKQIEGSLHRIYSAKLHIRELKMVDPPGHNKQSRQEHLRKALDAFQAVLNVGTHSDPPNLWGLAQEGLAGALLEQLNLSNGTDASK